MAINQDVQDIDNYPGTIKRVTLDLDLIVPTGAEGDEKMMLVGSTTAYSDNTNRTAIQDVYVAGGKVGWAKSNGLAGTAGKFNITSSAYKLGVSMDATVSGTYTDSKSSKPCYEISLTYNDSNPISGEDIASDMQTKIRALSMETADAGFQLAYQNASVSFTSGKFKITSGSISNYYTGADRSSVYVGPAQTMDATSVLGFENPLTSENVAGTSVAEAYLSSNYTAGGASVAINTGTGVAAGDALYISDGNNYDYFTALSGTTSTSVAVATLGTNGFNGITHNYTTTSGSYVQVLKKQDPDVKPNWAFDDMDGMLRYISKIIVNQIDFSS